MTNESKQFLNFNGTNINVLSVDGVFYLAIKPICTALGVDYEAQRKAIQNDEMLDGVPSIQTVHDASGRLQEMVCLPEKFVYGWLFSIRSKSEGLRNYKRECYEVLFNHFHGATTERIQILRSKSEDELLLEVLLAKRKIEVSESETEKKIIEVKARIKEKNTGLVQNDEKLKTAQLPIFHDKKP